MATESGLVICKVCNVELRSDGLPTGNGLSLERHHIIPRAFGGENGPVVDLCSSDHQLLHSVALCMTSRKPFAQLISELNEMHKAAIMWFASRVAAAYEATKNDPNKRVQITMILSAKQAARLDKVSKTLGQSSRTKTLELIINEAYNRRFSS